MKLKIGNKVRFKTKEAFLNTPDTWIDGDGDIVSTNGLLILESEFKMLGEVFEVGSSSDDVNEEDDDDGHSLYECLSENQFAITEDNTTYFEYSVIEEIVED
jgi:hypothetical protein